MAEQPHRIRKALLLVFLPALILRLALALYLPADDTVFADEPLQEYTRNFAAGKGFWMSRPYLGHLGIDRAYAFRPPLFPFLWGLIYNATSGAYAPVRAAHACLGALACLLAWLVAREIAPRRPIPLLTGLFCALYPPLIWHSVHLMTEPLFIFFEILAIYTLIRFQRTRRWRWLVIAAIAAALGTLSRSVLAGFLPLICVWLWWSCRREKRPLLRVIAFAAVVTAVMSPWIIRNAICLHAFVPTTTDAGHGFYVANNPRALEDPAGFHTPDDWRFLLKPGEQSLDEATAGRRLVRRTARWLLAHPAAAAHLMARRFLSLWRFYPDPKFIRDGRKILVYACAYIPVFIFMVPGAWLIHRTAGPRLPGLLLIDILIVYTVAVHTAILAMMRYRVPFMPFLLLFAATAVVAAWEKMSRCRRMPAEPHP